MMPSKHRAGQHEKTGCLTNPYKRNAMHYERAPAKVNLFLDVLDRREDGYHALDMVNQTVSLWDEVFFLEPAPTFSVSGNLSSLPWDLTNLAYRAAAAFFAALDAPYPSARLFLRKRIPMRAGLGGGSADAAAVLRLLNRRAGYPFSPTELSALALSLGSDVPYCLVGGTKSVTGRGEIIHPLSPLPSCHILITKPEISFSTADVFGKTPSRILNHKPRATGMAEALRTEDLRATGQHVFNALEARLPHGTEQIEAIRSEMLNGGALGASMTGSGSAVIGLFDRPDWARAVFLRQRAQYPFVRLTYPVGPVPVAENMDQVAPGNR